MDWDSLNQSLLSASYIDFNTARIAQPLAIEVDAPTTPPGSLDFRGPGSHGLDLRQLTRQANRVREHIATHFDVSSDKVYLGGSTTETLEFFLRNAEELRSAETALTTNREYGSLEKVLRNENYFDDMTWPAGREGLYQVFERHPPNVPENDVEQKPPKALCNDVNEEVDIVLSSYVTHDTGELLPVDDISDAAHAKDAYSIVDAAQAAFHIPFTYDEVGADLIVGSLHKYGHCLNTLGFGVWRGKPIFDTVHEPEYYLPRHRSREAFEAESTAKYNGPRRIAQISHAEATLSYRASIGWDRQYDRIEHLGDVAEDVLEADRESPGMLFIDGSKDLQEYLRTEYGIHTSYKDSSNRLRVSISPFNTELEIGVLGRAVETYKSSVNDVDFSPMRNRSSLLGDVL